MTYSFGGWSPEQDALRSGAQNEPSPLPARQRLELAALLAVGIAPFYFNGLYNAPLAAHHRAWFWVADVTAWIVLPLAVVLVGRRRHLFTIRDLGLHTRVRGRERPVILLALILVIAFVLFRLDVAVVRWALATLPAGWARPFCYNDVIPPPGPQTGWWRLLATIHLTFTAGFVEEVYYRGAVDRLFPPGWVAGFGYVVASTLVFAGVHWEGGPRNLAEAIAVGLFAATVFRLTRNLWPLVVGHIVIDWYWLAGAGS